MLGLAFRHTRLFLKWMPIVYILISALVLLHYVVMEPRHGWVYICIALFCLIMFNWARRIRYDLVDRRQRTSVMKAQRFLRLHLITVLGIPFLLKCQKELVSAEELQQFFADAYLDAVDGYDPAGRKALLAQLRILIIVAYFGLAVVAVVQASNEYIRFGSF